MTQNEIAYVDRFREAAEQRDRVEAAIRDLHAVCEAVKDWRKEAADLGGSALPGRGTAWDEERLRNLVALKGLLIRYDELRRSLGSAFSSLPLPARSGLAEPSSLDR